MKFLSKYLRLPETIWGVDTDEVFAYETNRKAWIRDRHLGVLYYFLITFILGWILGGQILWQNQHFVRRDVTGIQRMRSSHPTVNGCDPMDPHCQNNYLPIQDLPYCKDYKNTPWSDAAACRYEDNVAADPEGTVDNKLFFPTAVELVTEDLVDGQYVEDPGHNCLQSDYLCEGRGSQSNMFYYVADVAGFTVQFTSSYSRGSVQGSSLEEPGFFEICDAQLREEGDVKKWSTRLYDKHECVGEAVQEVPIPCQPGANCKELQKFDALKDTGENLKSRLKDSVHDLPGNLAMTQKRRSSLAQPSSVCQLTWKQQMQRRRRSTGRAETSFLRFTGALQPSSVCQLTGQQQMPRRRRSAGLGLTRALQPSSVCQLTGQQQMPRRRRGAWRAENRFLGFTGTSGVTFSASNLCCTLQALIWTMTTTLMDGRLGKQALFLK